MSRIALVGSLLLSLAGCSGSSSGASMAEPEATALPPIKVDLPPPPSFAASDIPEKNPDGTFTVRGLRKKKADNLNKEVKVKAYLLEVYQCPVCPKKQTCKLCDQPHFFMGDKPDTKKEKALMIVDYLMPKQKPPALTVGKQYDIAGTFAINSPTGFGSSDGLIVFDSMTDDKGVVFQSPSKALEEKALKGEAQEQALEQKRQAAMKKKH
ncbi:MAG: hypothetical protein ACXVDD_22795 [Polyangia bacterium]